VEHKYNFDCWACSYLPCLQRHDNQYKDTQPNAKKLEYLAGLPGTYTEA